MLHPNAGLTPLENWYRIYTIDKGSQRFIGGKGVLQMNKSRLGDKERKQTCNEFPLVKIRAERGIQTK